MLLASRLSEMHALEAQTLPAEPAGTGGRVAAGPPAPGPVLEPEVHDAASATAPSATTQIRLTTADLPAPPQLTELRSQSSPARGGPVPPDTRRAVCEERPPPGYLHEPSRRSCRWPAPRSRGRERPHLARPLARTQQLPGTGSSGPGGWAAPPARRPEPGRRRAARRRGLACARRPAEQRILSAAPPART